MIKLVDPDSSSNAWLGLNRLRGRLWTAGGALALVALCFAAIEIAQAVREPGGRLSLGHDLLPSYTAGLLVREGRADLLYDAQGFEQAARQVMVEANLAGDPRLAPWVNPPFVAWLFVPLSALPYRAAAAVWLGFSLLLFGGSLVLLCRMLGRDVG